ncbi:MAG: hypothetical protein Q7R75_00590 [bacterium]|nr:hypothetical protein [bacterium]
MWQNKFNGVMGLWVVALAFLGFSDSTQRILLVLSGLAVAIASFWGKSFIKPTEELLGDIQEEHRVHLHNENQQQDSLEQPSSDKQS